MIPEREGWEHRLANDHADKINATNGKQAIHPYSPPVPFNRWLGAPTYTKPIPEFLKIQV